MAMIFRLAQLARLRIAKKCRAAKQARSSNLDLMVKRSNVLLLMMKSTICSGSTPVSYITISLT